MYFAITKLTFEGADQTNTDRRDLNTLVEKVRSRFKVAVQPMLQDDTGSSFGIAIASVGQTEERLSQQVDAIAAFCEETGFGRVAKEETLIDDLDSFGDEEE